MNKATIIIFTILILISGCVVETGAKITNIIECDSQDCIDCLSKQTFCNGNYIKGYSWSNGVCGSDAIIQYCPNGCSQGKCIGEVSKNCKEANPLNFCSLEGKDYTPDYQKDDSLECPLDTPQCWVPTSLSVCNILENSKYENCKEFSGGGVCSGDDKYYCTQGSVYTAEKYGKKYYFCAIGSIPTQATFTTCPDGCSNGECAKQICLPNAEWCQDNKVFECSSDGIEISVQEECSNGEQCEEQSTYNAICRKPLKFCINNDGYNCILCNNQNGFNSLEECKNSLIYYCISTDRKTCIKREGGCLAGELENRGTVQDTVKKQCEGRICGKLGNECCAGDECNNGLVCKTDQTKKKLDGSYMKICVDDTNQNICEAECADEAWIKFGGTVILQNYGCILKCRIGLYFKPLVIILSIICGLIILLTTMSILRKKFKRKKDAWIPLTFGLVFGVAFGLILYLYILLFLIAIILYIVAMIALNRYLKR